MEALAGCEPFDSALLDLSLPDSDFQQTLNRISDIAALTAVLVLTSMNGNDLGDQAIVAGAQDFIVKSELIDTQIDKAVRYTVERHRFILENKRLTADLERRNCELDALCRETKAASIAKSEFPANMSHEIRKEM